MSGLVPSNFVVSRLLDKGVVVGNVVVIGAGVAGLTAAYRLQQSGHKVTVLEAKHRAGGLSHTARNGTVVTERKDGQLIQQTANLDDGLYVNLGPGRLPHHHRRILGLCHELNVELEPYLMSTEANYWVDARTATRYRRRRITHDARGHIAALAYAQDDPHELCEAVKKFGDLQPDGTYKGTSRAGDGDVVPLSKLTDLAYWRGLYWQPGEYLWQATMFQPLGGMDAIWRALLVHVGDRITFNAPVHALKVNTNGVTVTWRQSGDVAEASFDWCLSTIPLPQLAQDVDKSGFSSEFLHAVATPQFAAACKVGWQANRRWWQSDSEQIYGGISYSNHVIQQFWYPSTNFTEVKATLTGAYNSYDAATRFGAVGVRERLAWARRGGAMVHTEVADTDLVPDKHGMTVAWHNVPYQAGGWCHWNPDIQQHTEAFDRLQYPDGRFFVIGDQTSTLPGWQEGCLMTAQRGVDMINGVVSAAVYGQPPVAAPDSAMLTVGDHPDISTVVD